MDVSRETLDRLEVYHHLLDKWSRKINLVSPSTLQNARLRHFKDSLQLLSVESPRGKRWVDIGSGAGFPGAIIAIARAGASDAGKTILVESDKRKSVFLRTVSRETNADFTVLAERIECIEPLGADIISARALAPLSRLFDYAESHLQKGGVMIFPKGANWRQEVADAEKTWHFSYAAHRSMTDDEAVILRIEDLSRA
ncbi:16S rRNA (guanine(527)-N(7))-methyltransferase RsmG [Marivita sp. GX14005]|uniref:16S rRNA (guanine(527)-N(7))-methyltransferase RsmG n=1 Tax=Marivita sp. GX14005 TaxID=2942276 RepID=UPI002018F538|nr:16S rRNA (guanine(527)-N(7))-methyltransferase RsmG [Marivita sp. GX14005]MCL3881638.1 16S rRNA (guanine(527)-N(7))-methyltransferase RsmG [Marivita sp. GX14005]